MRLAKRLDAVKPSPTLAITAKAKELKAKGIDVVGFGAGEPDFDTPKAIKQAAVQAIDAGFTKYTPTNGIPELREAIAKRIAQEHGIAYKPTEVLVSCGGKHALYNLFQALLTLFWTVTAITTMIFASRRQRREQWFGGMFLLGVVGAKLLLFDAAGRGTLAWTGTLLGVALLVLAASYFAPLPPPAGGEEKEAL